MRRKGTVTAEFDPARPAPLTRKQKAEIKALGALPDEKIDFSDIPPLPEEFWKTAERGKFYRPLKRQLTLRLDADVVAWFKRHARGGRGYQTNINRALREYVLSRGKEGGLTISPQIGEQLTTPNIFGDTFMNLTKDALDFLAKEPLIKSPTRHPRESGGPAAY